MHRSVLRGTVLITIAVAVLVGLYFMPGAKSVKKPHPPNNDPWVMVSYDPNNQYGTYLSNGFISTRIMGDGVGSQDGKPLPCFVSGLYDDEKLIPCPTWSDLRFYDGKTQFKIDKEADYKQTLNMKTGILTTEATWRAGGKTLKGKIEMIVSRAEPNVGLVRAELMPDFKSVITAIAPHSVISDQLKKAPRQGLAKYAQDEQANTNPSGPAVDNFSTKHGTIAITIATRMSYSDSSRDEGGEGLDDFGTNNGPTQTSYVGIYARPKIKFVVSSYNSMAIGTDSNVTEGSASAALSVAEGLGDERFISNSTAAWAKLWKKDIVIDGPAEDQQAIHSCMFYLLQSVREGSDWSIPPMGLSNNAFSGHVFWDADLWMFPSLILQHPEMAKSIVAYRYKTLSGALSNAKEAGLPGAQYAWESGYTGKEDTPGGLVYRNERHINGDVALAQWQYYLATADANWLKSQGYPVIKATADYWAARVKYVPENGRYEILQVVPPDENADLVNNSAYTNCIAKTNLEIAVQAAKLAGQAPNPKWAEVADKLYIPYDASKKRFTAFDNYKGLQAKQADCELLAYPLQFTIPDQDMQPIYKNTYEFYAPKVFKVGPAMTSSVHAVIAARLGDRDDAYISFLKSYKPFLRGPFNYFNEKQSTTMDNMCFLTGVAGPIQAVLFGFAGAKMDYFAPQSQLQFKPCLPKQWKSLIIKGIHWQGKEFDVRINSSGKAEIIPVK